MEINPGCQISRGLWVTCALSCDKRGSETINKTLAAVSSHVSALDYYIDKSVSAFRLMASKSHQEMLFCPPDFCSEFCYKQYTNSVVHLMMDFDSHIA